MKIGFYDPYLDTLSGGERYILSIASHWTKFNDVTVFWDKPNILNIAEKKLNIDCSQIKVKPNIFKYYLFRKLYTTREYDLIFVVTDGSLPLTIAKYNILHFQVPFQKLKLSAFKLGRYNAIIYNSDFTKKNLHINYQGLQKIIYPPVKPINISGKKKQNYILNVGRFNPVKKQEVLITAFKKAVIANEFKNYKLILAGGLIHSDNSYFESLKAQINGYPIELLANCGFEKLQELYNESYIYWHATGFREANPENMEHFGITTVEAMSAGLVPVVYKAGGQTEIIRNGINGYVWQTVDELIGLTKKLILDEQLRKKISNQSIQDSHNFDIQNYYVAFDDLLTEIQK
jgi:glycosyltransferase involved in cell wall biosynthesis